MLNEQKLVTKVKSSSICVMDVVEEKLHYFPLKCSQRKEEIFQNVNCRVQYERYLFTFPCVAYFHIVL